MADLIHPLPVAELPYLLAVADLPKLPDSLQDSWIGFVLALGCILGLLFLRQLTPDPKVRKRAMISVTLFLIFLLLRLPLFLLDPTRTGPEDELVPNPPYQILNIVSLLVFAWALIQGLILLLVDFLIVQRMKREVPRILADVALIAIFVVSALLIIYYKTTLNITGLLSTAGVLSLVIGLALQDTLGNAFAGLALQTERPFRVGDWITWGALEGVITDVSWRSTQIRTRSNDLVTIPNSTLSKESFTNHSAPTKVSARLIHIGVSYTHPPSDVKRVMLAACREVPGILDRPQPLCRLHSFDAYYITYQVKFWIKDFAAAIDIDEGFRSVCWYAFKREGIEIPYPIQVEYQHEYHEVLEEERDRRDATDHILDRLRSVEFLAPLSGEELRTLAEKTKLHSYYKDETIIRQGADGDSFFLLDQGEVIVCVSKEEQEQEVARLRPPAPFGEMALLTGETRSATVRAASPVRILVIDKDAFRSIILGNPDLATEMSDIIARRQVELLAKQEELDKSIAAAQAERSRQILSRIRDFFGFRTEGVGQPIDV